MNKLQDTLRRFREVSLQHWNDASRLEPVGAKVRLLLPDGTTIKAYRKTPIESRESPTTYFAIEDDSVITSQHIGWQYL